jgi:iron complex outermembrane receptor protein
MCKQRPIRKWILSGTALSFLLRAVPADAANTNEVSKSSDDLENFTLEQLVNVQVTSVSKKETDLFTSPAAVYVISQEDIRRSGMTTIPDLLRMVPGLEVAQINGNQWEITSRGFNGQAADLLLVMIDGRTVYSPMYGGVFWNAQFVPLDEIDRIEVIRGPGATLWGVNAVNGVINIITKKSKDTQGGLVTVTFGTIDQPGTTVRYGGQLTTNLFYRGYVEYFNRAALENSFGQDTADTWNSISGGSRVDWNASADDQFTLQGDYYSNNAGETVDEATYATPFVNQVNLVDHDYGGDVLGHWTHDFSDTSQLNLQLYYDHSDEGIAGIIAKNDTYDFDLQHRFSLPGRQDIVWGAGFRYLADDTSPLYALNGFSPAAITHRIFNTFVQDEITVVEDRLHLTLGSKLEHNDITGFVVEPSGRLAWTPTKNQTLWAAVSRAASIPSDDQLDLQKGYQVSQPAGSPFPVLVLINGNHNLNAQELTAFELGYRIKPVDSLSFDVATFYNLYDSLITISTVPGTPYFSATPEPHIVAPLTFQNNNEDAQTYGAEISSEWSVTDYWRWVGSYTFLQEKLSPQPAYNNDPQNQFQIRTYLDLPHHVELNGALFYVDSINAQFSSTVLQVPSYFRLDLGVTWRPFKSLELGVFGENLAEARHLEINSGTTTVLTEIPRSVMGRITWSF